jgi:hypothetical protein
MERYLRRRSRKPSPRPHDPVIIRQRLQAFFQMIFILLSPTDLAGEAVALGDRLIFDATPTQFSRARALLPLVTWLLLAVALLITACQIPLLIEALLG